MVEGIQDDVVDAVVTVDDAGTVQGVERLARVEPDEQCLRRRELAAAVERVAIDRGIFRYAA